MPDKTLRTFNNAVALVTGGASGIGRALSEALATRGCEVVIADRQIEMAEQAAAGIRKAGGRATASALDVSDYQAVKQLAEQTVERTGRMDYLFNNAGIGGGGLVQECCIDDWKYILDVNLCGVINGIQAVYSTMAAQGFGHIVNTASMAGLIPSPGMVSYSTTKHAVVGLSKSLRAEAAHLGIRVSVLCPGVVRTDILDGGGKYNKTSVEISHEQKQQMLEMFEKLNPMPPAVFAKQALDQVAKNKAIIVVPSWWKRFWWIHRLFPSFGMSLAQKQFEKMQKQVAG